MRVAIYNQMFGMNGRDILDNLYAHWSVHFRRDLKRVGKNARLGESVRTIRKVGADVIGICEVLEMQEDEMRERLAREGYGYCFFGRGHRTKYSGERVEVAIASKIECEKIESEEFPVSDEIGGGGGYVHCRFMKREIDILCVHMANEKKRELYEKQRDFLDRNIRDSKHKAILMGDFNRPYGGLKKEFWGFELASGGIKSCSMNLLFRWFSLQDLDHIFSRGMKIDERGYVDGRSDHRLIYVDFCE